MPGFVKTSADEALWERAKAAAQKQYPTLEGDKFYAAANTIFHNMKSGSRTERHGNPGEPKVVDQYPTLEGKPSPMNKMEKYWQPTADSVQKAQERYYDDRGARKPIARRVPIGGGGEGQNIGRLSGSSLAKGGN